MRRCRQLFPHLGLLLVVCFILGGCFGLGGPTPTSFPSPPDLTLLVDGGQWRYPSWSPTGSEIAFLYNHNPSPLLRADVSTGKMVVLVGEVITSTLGSRPGFPVYRYPDGPSWSPQGDRIAFVREMGLRRNIYVVGRDGAGLVKIGEGWSPTWSPDGKWLAFSGPEGGLFIVHPDGTAERQLTTRNDRDPAWSPDGRRIAFVSSEWDWSQSQICVVNADGSGASKLTTDPDYKWAPAWSPDGSKIVFLSLGEGKDGSSIRTMAPDGSGQAIVATDTGLYPAWSPDGRLIAFCDYSRGLYVVDAEGGDRRLVAAPGGRECWDLSWSPDGERIAFACGRNDVIGHDGLTTGSAIYVVRVNP